MLENMIQIWRKLQNYLFEQESHVQRKWDALVVAFYAFLALFLPYSTFDWDSYVRWANQIRVLGLENIYHYQYVNYMPFNVFAIHLWQLLCASMNWDLVGYFQMIKIYPMIFDALTVLLLFRFAKRYQASLLTVAVLFLPNIAIQYNSFIWGQFDSVYAFFALLAGYFILKKQPTAALVAFVFAMNAKIQAIIFLPTLISFIWLFIFQPRKAAVKESLRTALFGFLEVLVKAAGIGVVLQFALLLPFRGTLPLKVLTLIVERSASLSTWVTFNADNFWTLIGVPSMKVSDVAIWQMGMSYHSWGLGLFVVASCLTFLPLLGLFLSGFQWFQSLFSRSHIPLVRPAQLGEKQVAQMFALVCYLQSLSFFFFLTQMHERYSHPTLVFAGLFAIISRKKTLFLITCLAYLINLEQVDLYWKHLIDLSKISWIGQLSAALFLIGLVLALASLYRLYLAQADRKRAA